MCPSLTAGGSSWREDEKEEDEQNDADAKDELEEAVAMAHASLETQS
jgi:hypothetical protein